MDRALESAQSFVELLVISISFVVFELIVDVPWLRFEQAGNIWIIINFNFLFVGGRNFGHIALAIWCASQSPCPSQGLAVHSSSTE